jgi:hypothetical protein
LYSPTENAFQEVPGSSILQALSTLRTQQGFYSLPHNYLRAGFSLLVRNIAVILIIVLATFCGINSLGLLMQYISTLFAGYCSIQAF